MVEHIHFGFQQNSFPREFATFVGFVGGREIDRFIYRVSQKLAALAPEARKSYGERYFFHDEFQRFAASEFRLNTTRFNAVRAASIIAAVNHVSGQLLPDQREHFRTRVLEGLDPSRDVRQIEHELRCYTHFARKRYRVNLALPSADDKRVFDWLVTTSARQVEVECKTIGEDAGVQIKTDLGVGLCETFRKYARAESFKTSGMLTFQLHQPAADCKGLAGNLRALFQSNMPLPHKRSDFSLAFEARVDWQNLFDASKLEELKITIANEAAGDIHCAKELSKSMVGIVFKPHAPTALRDNVVNVLKDASKQCSGNLPAIIWVHFTGRPQDEFRKLVEFSRDNSGQGLNAAVALAMLNRTGEAVRKHVERVRFSADPDILTRSPTLAPNLMIVPSVSVDGLVYDVPNPHCIFTRVDDL